ncbi:MAG: hypothetical protein H3C35_11650 [Bacteroidetes bacterium]|nr:hypothetical protein [Bacteroidota bacterium]
MLSLFWIIIFCLAALLFFGTAAVITFIGMQDLKDLLKNHKKKSSNP